VKEASRRRLVSSRLPAVPWDTLLEAKARAAEHPDGIVDLSIGTPVDPTPGHIQHALKAAADAPGYPTVWGTPGLRAAILDSVSRRCGAGSLDETSVLPTVGSKELVGSLAAQLGIGAGQTVLVPALAYPTYAVGARLAGAAVLASDSTLAAGPLDVPLVWLNSPANPTGRVLPVEHLRKVVAWARERDAVVAVDECYLELWWDVQPVSVLDPIVNGGSLSNILAVHSLSKSANLAGYRAGYVVGDPRIVSELLEVRKHAGLIVPAPIQAAMVAALTDDAHVAEQRERYRVRRAALRPAFEAAGFRIDHSEASLYLWATRGEACRDTVAWLAERGILVGPGDAYGTAGAEHVRIALTATDERVEAAVSRLTGT
jgi:succinyldiaminopimelate transaminase